MALTNVSEKIELKQFVFSSGLTASSPDLPFFSFVTHDSAQKKEKRKRRQKTTTTTAPTTAS
jgi:hypothetical protein